MYGTIPFLIMSRFAIGIATGLYLVIFGKLICENLPEKLAQKVAMCQNVAIGFSINATLFMAGFLPDPKDFEANKNDENWRIIYLTPALIGVIELILIIFVLRYDPIAFCITKGFEEQSKKHMRLVYRKVDPNSPETIDEILDMQYKYQ